MFRRRDATVRVRRRIPVFRPSPGDKLHIIVLLQKTAYNNISPVGGAWVFAAVTDNRPDPLEGGRYQRSCLTDRKGPTAAQRSRQFYELF